MRVTQRMLAQSVSRNIANNLYVLGKKAEQLSSGRCFNRPSQDPAGTFKVMRITGTGLYRNEQYQRNIGEGITWLTVTEDALADTIEIMHTIKERTIYAANGTLSSQDRALISPEIEELFNHLVNIGNTEVGGLYIFGGYKTQAPPYAVDLNEAAGVQYRGDAGQRIIEITPSQMLAINFSGKDAFGELQTETGREATGTELFQTVRRLINALTDNDAAALGGEIIQEVDARLDFLLQQRAQIGARMKRLDTMEHRLQGEHIHLRELRSKIEDLDLAAAITEFTMQKNTYQAALATGAQMIYPSLIDFLR